MKKELDAIYENGVFKPLTSPEISEGQQVKIIVETVSKPQDLLALAARVYEGLSDREIEEVEKIALDRSHFFGDSEK